MINRDCNEIFKYINHSKSITGQKMFTKSKFTFSVFPPDEVFL